MPLIQDTSAKNDKLIGNSGVADTFYFNQDGNRDQLFGFEHGLDRIDLTQYNLTFSDLKIIDKFDGSGVRIVIGDTKEKLFVPGAVAADFDASDFVFSGPVGGAPVGPFTTFADSDGIDKFDGTSGADLFVFSPDGDREVIRNFDDGQDVIDLTAYGVTFDDLKIVNKANGGGVRIVVEGEKIHVKDVTAADFTSEDFLFV